MSLGAKHARENTLPTPPAPLPPPGTVPDSIVFTARHGKLGLHRSSTNFVFLCHNPVGNCPRRFIFLSIGVSIDELRRRASCAEKHRPRRHRRDDRGRRTRRILRAKKRGTRTLIVRYGTNLKARFPAPARASEKKEGKHVTGPVSECNKAETAALLAVDVDEFPVHAEVLLRIF